MEGGPPCFRPGSTCPVLLWCLLGRFLLSRTGLLPPLAGFSKTVPLEYIVPHHRSTTPWSEDHGLASFPFARRYLENRVCFLFLRVLRCFSSPRSLLMSYVFTHGYMCITTCEFPHSEICGSNGYVLLTAAYRSLSRPSSAPSAKAFTSCSSLLELLLEYSFDPFSESGISVIICRIYPSRSLSFNSRLSIRCL